MAVIRVADPQLGPHPVEKPHRVQRVLQRHHWAFREALLDAPCHFTQLIGVSAAHDLKGFDAAFFPSGSDNEFTWIINRPDALQEAFASGDAGCAWTMGEQRGC